MDLWHLWGVCRPVDVDLWHLRLYRSVDVDLWHWRFNLICAPPPPPLVEVLGTGQTDLQKTGDVQVRTPGGCTGDVQGMHRDVQGMHRYASQGYVQGMYRRCTGMHPRGMHRDVQGMHRYAPQGYHHDHAGYHHAAEHLLGLLAGTGLQMAYRWHWSACSIMNFRALPCMPPCTALRAPLHCPACLCR